MNRFNRQHKPFLTPIWLLGASALIVGGIAFAMAWVWLTADTTTIVVASAVDESALARMFEGFPGTGRVDSVYRADAARRSRDIAHDIVRRHRGGRILVLADVPMVSELVEALSANKVPKLQADTHFLYVVTVPRIGDANVLRVSY
jgi:hypothetical protein